MKKIILIISCLIFITGCSNESENKSADSTQPITTAISQEETMPDDKKIIEEPIETNAEKENEHISDAQTYEQVDLSEYFQGINGCTVIYDTRNDKYSVYNQELVDKRSSPCSTFKIVSTLIGLKSNILESAETKFQWNGTTYPISEWDIDLTLKEAFGSSAVWYFKKVIENAGADNTLKTLQELNYGNCDISEWSGSNISSNFEELNGFWLESSLLISPREQVDVLIKIFSRDSEYSSYTPIMKNIMLSSESEAFGKIYGKTGTGYKDNQCVDAWFVGFAEKDNNVYYFAVRLDDPGSKDISGKKAKEIAVNIINGAF